MIHYFTMVNTTHVYHTVRMVMIWFLQTSFHISNALTASKSMEKNLAAHTVILFLEHTIGNDLRNTTAASKMDAPL